MGEIFFTPALAGAGGVLVPCWRLLDSVHQPFAGFEAGVGYGRGRAPVPPVRQAPSGRCRRTILNWAGRRGVARPGLAS